jgi:hypothetical protein
MPLPVTAEFADADDGCFPTARPTEHPSHADDPPTPHLAAPVDDDRCCVMPSWSPDSKQVLFIDKPSTK